MLTQTQRLVLEEVVRKARRGPSLGFAGQAMTTEQADKQARIWSDTWIAEAVQTLLDADSGDSVAKMNLLQHKR